MVEMGRPERSARSETVKRVRDVCSGMGMARQDNLPAVPDEVCYVTCAGLRGVGHGVLSSREQHLRLQPFIAGGRVAGLLRCPQVGFQRRSQPGASLLKGFIMVDRAAGVGLPQKSEQADQGTK